MQWILCFGNQRSVQTHLYILKKEHLSNGKRFLLEGKRVHCSEYVTGSLVGGLGRI